MSSSAVAWFLFNILSIIILASYSMLEMACVSFNKVRLQYYVSKGSKRAIWINDLLQNPAKLFGTTLIGVNIALVVGSECSRQFYAALGLSPDLAPLTQVLLVVIFGELAPMFAARHYAEHVAMLGIPIIYASSKLMTPLLWGVSQVTTLCNKLLGIKESTGNIYLTQEELQKVLEEHTEEESSEAEGEEFSAIAANIFSIRHKDIKKIMEPLTNLPMLPASANVKQMEILMSTINVDNVPLYNKDPSNIIGVAYPRDLLRASEHHKLRNYSRPPWFVSETATLMQILTQFRTNNESAAIILNHAGRAIGRITLDDILEEIFGKVKYPYKKHGIEENLMLIEKKFPGETTVAEFYDQYTILLDKDPSLTLSDLITKRLGHHPEKGESIYIAPFELTVTETTLVDVKTISISTKT